jgi:hypothetical protein
MRFWDSKRGHLANGLPTLEGAPQVAVSGVYVVPLENGRLQVGTYAPREGSAAGAHQWLTEEVRVEELGVWMAGYVEDPEAVLRRMGWSWAGRATQAQTTGAAGTAPASAADLGL